MSDIMYESLETLCDLCLSDLDDKIGEARLAVDSYAAPYDDVKRKALHAKVVRLTDKRIAFERARNSAAAMSREVDYG